MKKIKVLFMVIFILLFASCGKPREVKYEDIEKREGIIYVKGENEAFTGIVKGYDYGNLVSVETYKNGKLDGTSKEYGSTTGKLLYKAEYKDGKLYKDGKIFNGLEEKYDEYGKLSEQIPYTDGKINGVAIYYFRGKLFKEEAYVDGKKEGISKLYTDNERLILETPYFNDEINGVQKSYISYGEYTETTYVNGKKQGVTKRYRDGKLVEESSYQNFGKKGIKNKIADISNSKKEEIIKYAEQSLNYYLKDPASYQRISAYISGDKVHIRYRAKNSFGAYDIDEIDIPIKEYWLE